MQAGGPHVCDNVNTMNTHPYRNETVRLLLHNRSYAIKVSFLFRFLLYKYHINTFYCRQKCK